MALSREQVGLVFNVSADSKEAKAELVELKGFLEEFSRTISTEFRKTFDDLDKGVEKSTKGAKDKASDATKGTKAIVREAAETLTSEIIENFGVDGDIANVLADQVINIRNKTVLMVAAVAGAVAAVVAAGVILVKFANDAADLGDTIDELSERTGLSADSLSGLNIAAEQADKSLTDLEGPLQRINLALVEARRGSKELQSIFRQLDVDLKGSTDDALRQIIKRFNEIDDSSTKAALAAKLGISELLPVINELGGDLDAATRKAKELGLYFDTEGAKSAANYKDQVKGLSLQLEGLKISIGQSAIPAVTGLVKVMRFAMSDTAIWTVKLVALAAAYQGLKDVLAGGSVAEGIQKVAIASYLAYKKVFADMDKGLGGEGDDGDFKFDPKKGSKTKEDKALKKAMTPYELDGRNLKAIEEFNRKRDELELEGLERIRKAEEEHADDIETIARAEDDRLAALYQEAAQNRVLSEEDAANAIAAIRIAAFAREEDRLKAERDATIEGTEEHQRAEDKLNILEARRATAIEEAGIRIRAARQQDTENLKQNVVAAEAYAGTLRDQVAVAFGQAANVLGTFNDAFGAGIDAFIQSAGSLRAAGRAIVQSLIAPWIAWAAFQAKMHAAEAIGALARWDLRGFALHSLAAVGFAVLGAAGTAVSNAAFAGGGGASIAPSGTGAGGSSSGPQSMNGRQAIQQGGDRQRERVIVIRAEHAPGVIIDAYERDFRSNGRTRQLPRGDILGEAAG